MLATSTDDWASTEESPTTLTKIEPFADLPVAVFAAIDEISVLRSYGAGETIFAMGQYDGSEILLVRTGAIRASYADYQTGAMLFEEFVAGQCYNLARAVVGGEDPRFAQLTLSASEETELVSIDAEAFREIVAQRPSLTKNLMYHFAREIAGGGTKVGAAETSPERRVYAALVEYVERDAVSAEWRIVRMPKHRELADRANVDEADAAAAIASLIQSGVARREYPGLVITDISQLNHLAN
jgi:CRP-like cAMP-binding protein